MKKTLLAALTLCVLFVSVHAVPTMTPRLVYTITATPSAVPLGTSVHLSGSITNNTQQPKSYRAVDIAVESGCVFYVGVVAVLNVTVNPGETFVIEGDYTAPCADTFQAELLYFAQGGNAPGTEAAITPFAVQ